MTAWRWWRRTRTDGGGVAAAAAPLPGDVGDDDENGVTVLLRDVAAAAAAALRATAAAGAAAAAACGRAAPSRSGGGVAVAVRYFARPRGEAECVPRVALPPPLPPQGDAHLMRAMSVCPSSATIPIRRGSASRSTTCERRSSSRRRRARAVAGRRPPPPRLASPRRRARARRRAVRAGRGLHRISRARGAGSLPGRQRRHGATGLATGGRCTRRRRRAHTRWAAAAARPRSSVAAWLARRGRVWGERVRAVVRACPGCAAAAARARAFCSGGGRFLSSIINNNLRCALFI